MKNKKNIIIFSVIISLILFVGVFTTYSKLNNNKLIENVRAESTINEKIIEKVSDKTENVGDTSAVTEKVVEKETEKEIQSDEKENQAGINSKVNEKVTEEPATTKSPEITTKKQETTTKKQETTTKKVETTTKTSETTTQKPTEKATEKPTTTQPAVTTIFNCGTLSGGYSATNYETSIFNAINAKRNENGLSLVSYNSNIHTLARIRADEQSLLKGHTRPNGNKASTIFKDKGINFTHFGEIIAVNIPDTDAGVELAIKMWMESDSHRNAILNGNYAYAAVAASPAGNGYMNIVCLFYNYIG